MADHAWLDCGTGRAHEVFSARVAEVEKFLIQLGPEQPWPAATYNPVSHNVIHSHSPQHPTYAPSVSAAIVTVRILESNLC